jgi:hypothetical protein
MQIMTMELEHIKIVSVIMAVIIILASLYINAGL